MRRKIGPSCPPMDTPRDRLARLALPTLWSVLALAYAVAVVVVTWRSPEKGFLAFTERRVIEVTEGGLADRAGVRRGDLVVAVDGRPLVSTLDYVDRLLRRRPGEVVELGLHRKGVERRVTVALRLGHSPAPFGALVACALAAMLLALGLVARAGRPGDPAAIRFFRTCAVYAVVYAGALSWNSLLVHPLLAAACLAALFLAPPLAMDFSLTFPSPPRQSVRLFRVVAYAPTFVLLVGTVVSIAWAVADLRAGIPTDRALRWTVRLVAAQLSLAVLVMAIGLFAQFRNLRHVSGEERGQLKWLLFGFSLCVLPFFVAVPVAIVDFDRFLLLGYRPLVGSIAVLWFVAVSLAVLRVRLADVDAVIHRSMTYAIASGAAAAVYLAVVLAVGMVAGRVLGEASLPSHLVAAVAALAAFGPMRTRVRAWLDRRFFRDRVHYVHALRELAEAVTTVREPRELATEAVNRTVTALRASSGALYLAAPDGASVVLAQSVGREFPEEASLDEVLAAAGGVAIPIQRAAKVEGVLVLGDRKGGDLYSSEDRDLLVALAGQLAVAIENARAFSTIREMSSSLEGQNREIALLRDKLEDENRYLRGRLEDARGTEDRIVGSSRPVRELVRQMERVAGSAASVLLVGESGTGKGLVARAIHGASDRAERAFIHVDCGAIPQGVFESELFGHERGAFTGAVRARRGLFELADGGTLFQDEIGELPLALQPKLLRALQDHSFQRVGGSRPVSVDVRILAATNRDLSEMAQAGGFRKDLYYRLRVVEIAVPPLRERKGDIRDLVEFVLPRICRRNHKPPRTLSAEALRRLEAYGWPGNVRELENVLERAAILCEATEIQAADLALADAPPSEEALLRHAAPVGEDAGHREVMESLERRRLVAALEACGGNQSRAARSLGIARTTLINKLRRHGL
ncbi:MAG: sigma 54-interacting transcriptional regulator [Deltaproteobacteria bacterium]|nr:sigma 54-interacting transcriptional regulator [Deltaproteobacteria bacterium]